MSWAISQGQLNGKADVNSNDYHAQVDWGDGSWLDARAGRAEQAISRPA